MKNRKYQILSTLILMSAFMLLSCRNQLSAPVTKKSKTETSVVTQDTTEKTYLSVSVTNTDVSARTIKADNYEKNTFQDFVLVGKLSGETKELLTASNLTDFYASSEIEIQSGEWELTLSAKYNGIVFKDTKTVSIKANRRNNVSFTLAAQEHFGGLYVEFDVSNSNVFYANVNLKKKDSNKTIISNLELPATEEKIIVSCDIGDYSNRLESGLYILQVDFYGSSNIESLLNQYESYIAIADGLVSTAQIALDFNEVYTITYLNSEDVPVTNFTGAAVAVGNYSVRSSFDLPKAKSTTAGYVFTGWKNSNNEYVTKIDPGTKGNLVLTAEFKEAKLYVSGTGDDEGEGFSETTALETINKACELIIRYGYSDLDWTIYIDGDVTGPHSSTKKAGARGTNAQYNGDVDFGRSEIPATITTDYAKSILLIGKNGLDANGIHQDMLNRGLIQGASAYPFPTGNVLAVATTVPVTIKNLKITGGNNSSTKANSTNDPYYANGGGLNVAAGATVTLDDGVLITKNKAVNGGAVYNAGTLYMVGSAAIGDKTVQTYPQATVTVTNGCSNEYSKGGGIYNTGTVYLGTSGTSGKELTGGIYNSYGSGAYGGGLYNAGSGTIFMSSGNIKYNDGQQHGGGVYLESGTFTMTGGELFFNSTAGNGGGVFVNIGAVFNFCGGKISGHNANGDHGSGCGGGGVYIEGSSNGVGKMFMYGSAVIGDSSKTTSASAIVGATTEELGEAVLAAQNLGCNVAPSGAGILTLGELYLGYSSEGVPDPLTGGIYYNTAKGNSNGGGLYIKGNYSKVLMNSGTIANNYAATAPGIYLYSSDFTMSSHTVGDNKYVPVIPQGIYHGGSYAIKVDSLFDSAATGAYQLIPKPNSDSNGYSNYTILTLTSAATAQNITLSNVLDKFVVEPFVNPKTGIASNWIINSDGKLVKNEVTINVSSNGQCNSIADAVAQMNDTDTDYIIALSGEITGPQTISGTVNANSITIKGVATNNNSNVPADGINANLRTDVAGTALTIDTAVPVTLDHIFVKGGHGTEKDGAIIGGGLLLGQNARVCLDTNTRILQNKTYDDGNGTPGYGAGVYISRGAKLFENKSCHITENTATSKGAGVYIASGGCLQTMAGSGSYVTLNTFDTNFKDENGNAIVPCGGAVYIENGATHEMFGAWFRDNCQDVDNCLGSGIYVSSTGNLKIKGYTEVIAPNDIYLQSNVKVGVADTLSPSNPDGYGGPVFTGRLTPETYPVDGTDVVLIKLADGSALSGLGNSATKFEITPQIVSGGKQIWGLDTSGKLIKQTGTGLSVTITTGLTNDIQVTVTSGGATVDNNTHLAGGATLVFTATLTDALNYTWTVDGEEQPVQSPKNVLTVNTTGWLKGVYDVYLEATDQYQRHYSYTAQIKVN